MRLLGGGSVGGEGAGGATVSARRLLDASAAGVVNDHHGLALAGADGADQHLLVEAHRDAFRLGGKLRAVDAHETIEIDRKKRRGIVAGDVQVFAAARHGSRERRLVGGDEVGLAGRVGGEPVDLDPAGRTVHQVDPPARLIEHDIGDAGLPHRIGTQRCQTWRARPGNRDNAAANTSRRNSMGLPSLTPNAPV